MWMFKSKRWELISFCDRGEGSPAELEERGHRCRFRKGNFLLTRHYRERLSKGKFRTFTPCCNVGQCFRWNSNSFSVVIPGNVCRQQSCPVCALIIYTSLTSLFLLLFEFCINTKYKDDPIRLIFFNLPSRSLEVILEQLIELKWNSVSLSE